MTDLALHLYFDPVEVAEKKMAAMASPRPGKRKRDDTGGEAEQELTYAVFFERVIRQKITAFKFG
eukprot:SAG25_NODE_667_length_6052_cov_7.366202_3_plen_65_part_00